MDFINTDLQKNNKKIKKLPAVTWHIQNKFETRKNIERNQFK